MDPIRWGILATGNIANQMAQALTSSKDAEIVAVASRSKESAEAFGKKWNIPNRYATYQALVDDPDVDIVYIATPHNFHYENMQMCLKADKHVLCEKAFTLNATQAEECIDLARQKNLFLMEAMWMRFFPAIVQVRRWLQEGLLGDVRFLQADFCLKIPFDPQHRLYNPHLGGGALLDLGIYPLSFTTMVLGLPNEVRSYAHMSKTGVDELDTMQLIYDRGASASLSCSMRVYQPREAFIVGPRGYIKVHNIFFCPDRLTLHITGQDPQDSSFPIDGNGLIYEVQEVHSCLQAGKTESTIMSLNETLELMKLMDSIRAEWGFQYPEEQNKQSSNR